jgi:hypothetical protein
MRGVVGLLEVGNSAAVARAATAELATGQSKTEGHSQTGRSVVDLA